MKEAVAPGGTLRGRAEPFTPKTQQLPSRYLREGRTGKSAPKGDLPMPAKLAAVGPRDSVLAFKALGLTVVAATLPADAARALRKLAQEGYAVIFLTEDLAAQMPETLAEYRAAPYPAVIPVPGHRGSNGFGLAGVHRDVEKAIGSDMLLNVTQS